MGDKTRTQHLTAEERREAVLDAAVTEFAQRGLHGTSTEDIARRAGISQPYVFRLFGTKKELFMAAAERICARVERTFQEAAQTAGGGNVLEAMGKGYVRLVSNREELLLMLQAFAAAADPDVQALMRRRFDAIYQRVRQMSGASTQEARDFMAIGMLITVTMAIDLPALLGYENWAEARHDYLEETHPGGPPLP